MFVSGFGSRCGLQRLAAGRVSGWILLLFLAGFASKVSANGGARKLLQRDTTSPFASLGDMSFVPCPAAIPLLPPWVEEVASVSGPIVTLGANATLVDLLALITATNSTAGGPSSSNGTDAASGWTVIDLEGRTVSGPAAGDGANASSGVLAEDVFETGVFDFPPGSRMVLRNGALELPSGVGFNLAGEGTQLVLDGVVLMRKGHFWKDTPLSRDLLLVSGNGSAWFNHLRIDSSGPAQSPQQDVPVQTISASLRASSGAEVLLSCSHLVHQGGLQTLLAAREGTQLQVVNSSMAGAEKNGALATFAALLRMENCTVSDSKETGVVAIGEGSRLQMLGSENRVLRSGVNGVEAQRGGFVELHNCLIDDNGSVDDGNGVHAVQQGVVELVNCTVSNSTRNGALVLNPGSKMRAYSCNFRLGQQGGVEVLDAAHALIEDTVVEDNGRVGVRATDFNSSVLCVNSTSRNNREHGFQAYGGANLTMRDSEAFSNNNVGVWAGEFNASVDLTRCRLHSNREHGLFAMRDVMVTARSCSSSDNNNVGFWVGDGGGAQVMVVDTDLSRNGEHGMFAMAVKRVEVIGSRANGNAQQGLFIFNEGNMMVRDSTLVGNGDDGIHAEGDLVVMTAENTVARGNGGDGIGVQTGATASVTNCTAVDNGVGIDAFDRVNMDIQASTFRRNAQNGLIATAGSRVSVSGTTMSDNSRGVIIAGAEAVLESCTIVSNSGSGLTCREAGEVSVQNSMVSSNAGDGVFAVDPGSNITVESCSILDNSRAGVRAAEGGSIEVLSSTITGSGQVDARLSDIDSSMVLDDASEIGTLSELLGGGEPPPSPSSSNDTAAIIAGTVGGTLILMLVIGGVILVRHWQTLKAWKLLDLNLDATDDERAYQRLYPLASAMDITQISDDAALMQLPPAFRSFQHLQSEEPEDQRSRSRVNPVTQRLGQRYVRRWKLMAADGARGDTSSKPTQHPHDALRDAISGSPGGTQSLATTARAQALFMLYQLRRQLHCIGEALTHFPIWTSTKGNQYLFALEGVAGAEGTAWRRPATLARSQPPLTKLNREGLLQSTLASRLAAALAATSEQADPDVLALRREVQTLQKQGWPTEVSSLPDQTLRVSDAETPFADAEAGTTEGMASASQTSLVSATMAMSGGNPDTINTKLDRKLAIMARVMMALPDVSLSVDPYHDIRFVRKLGRGAMANVYEGWWTAADGTDRHVAVKVMDMNELAGRSEHGKMLSAVQSEMGIMSRVLHPNIVRCYGGCVRSDVACLMLEYMEGGDLESYIRIARSSGALSLGEVQTVGIQLSSALSYIHPLIIHSDLKPQNVLLDAEGTVKLSDFGLSKIKVDTAMTSLLGGTPAYTAPEVFQQGQQGGFLVTEKADIYSLGMVLWECLTGRRPWDNFQFPMQVWYEVHVKAARPEIPEGTPERLRSLLSRCWHGDPRERPSAAEVLISLHSDPQTSSDGQQSDSVVTSRTSLQGSAAPMASV